MKRTAATIGVIFLFLAAAIELRAQAVQNIVLRNSFSPIGAGARGVGIEFLIRVKPFLEKN